MTTTAERTGGMKITTRCSVAKVRNVWGHPLYPEGATVEGIVTQDGRGILFRLPTGIYVDGRAGVLHSMNQDAVRAALSACRAASALGAMGRGDAKRRKIDYADLGRKGGKAKAEGR